MKEFVEKLIKHFKTHEYCSDWIAVSDVITIINQLAEEYNNGWIPVSERLPETSDDVLCWYEYFRYGEYNRMYETYGIGYYLKPMNAWGGEVSSGRRSRVIAWQPLPNPFAQKEVSHEDN